LAGNRTDPVLQANFSRFSKATSVTFGVQIRWARDKTIRFGSSKWKKMGSAGKPAEREFYKSNRKFKNNAFIISSNRNAGEGCQIKWANGQKKPPPKCRVGRSLNLDSKWAPLSFFRLF